MVPLADQVVGMPHVLSFGGEEGEEGQEEEEGRGHEFRTKLLHGTCPQLGREGRGRGGGKREEEGKGRGRGGGDEC